MKHEMQDYLADRAMGSVTPDEERAYEPEVREHAKEAAEFERAAAALQLAFGATGGSLPEAIQRRT